MNLRRFLSVTGLGTGVIGLSAHAALLDLSPYQSGPYYSDFTANDLDVNYVYTGNSSQGTGVFTVGNEYNNSSIVTEGNAYNEGSEAPGTHGSDNGTVTSSYYSLTADISWNGSVATLTGGSFDIYGILKGQTTSSLLLSGSLETGAGSVAFGYVDHTATMTTGEYNQFDFLINLGSLTGNSQIVQDYLQSMGGTGAIIVNADFDYTPSGPLYTYNNGSTTTTKNLEATTYQGFQGYWDQNFANPAGNGTADTFVPEPAAYPWGASIAALLACACSAWRAWPFAREFNGVKHQ